MKKLTFEFLMENLKAAKVPCTLQEDETGHFLILLGSNYPEELADKVFEFIPAEFGYKDFSVCADASGFKVIRNTRINGGNPEMYWGPLRKYNY